MLIKVGGIDPSLRATGLAKGVFDTDTGLWTVTEIKLVETEKRSGKTVRSSSDDLRCATELTTGIDPFLADCGVVCAEVPSGAQSARAAFGLGIAVGVLGFVNGAIGQFKGSLVQLNPQEVKKQAVGSKVASKEEMIEWAASKWPDLPWYTDPRSTIIVGGKKLQAKNEHVADACAIINAGILTDEFRSLVNVFRQAQNLRSA